MQTLGSSTARSYAVAAPPARSLSWKEACWSVVDLELTGLDPAADEIIAFAVVTVARGRVRLGDAVFRLVRPRHMPGPETIRIHGLREADLAQAPPLDVLLDVLLEAITGRGLVAHGAQVEGRFLSAALHARGLRLQNPIVDTAALATELWRLDRSLPGKAPRALSDLARALNLPVHRPHHADGDALTTAQCFLALATRLERFGAATVGALEDISRPPTALSRLRRLFRRLPRLAATAN